MSESVKFVQIACESQNDGSYLWALDTDGQIWLYQGPYVNRSRSWTLIEPPLRPKTISGKLGIEGGR